MSSRRTAAIAALSAVVLSACQYYTLVSTAADLGQQGVAHNPANDPDPVPTALDPASRSLPIVIGVHGFAGTPYELQDARDYLQSQGITVYRVLMGGHGLDYDSQTHQSGVQQFSTRTWHDWEAPVEAAYNQLADLGYTNIGFLTSSTGGPVTMELVSSGKLHSTPTRISMVAPILDFKNKLAAAAGLLQTFGAFNDPSPATGSAVDHWYADYPVSEVEQLIDLTEVMKHRLRGTIVLPSSMKIEIFQSKGDGTADPVSAPLWLNGIKGPLVSLYWVDSSHHIPISTDTDGFSASDLALKTQLLEQIATFHKS